jgi:hypothetical protein
VARESSTRHFTRPVIVVEEPEDTVPQASDTAGDLRANVPAVRSATWDAWDDVDTQPDVFARLFDRSDTDEVPTLTMRRPRPRPELNPAEGSLDPAEVGVAEVGLVLVIDEHAGADVITSAHRVAKGIS